jgi:anaerobic magnesium-protoporphyrin IX monomethyl ester cyclase
VPDVLLGQAYYLRFDPKLWRAQQPYAPLGTLYAASYLRSRGYTAALFDAMLARSENEWADALDRVKPRVAVIYEDSFNYLTKMCLLRMRQAAETMIGLARARGCPVIVSGSDATDHPEVYLSAGADAVVMGEGEVTLAELVGAFVDNRPPGEAAGVAHLDDHGTVVRTRARPFVRALDDLPRPAWDLVDVAAYRRIWRRRHGYHAMNLATTRGCPYHCNWCAKPIYGQRYAVRTAANVIDEIRWLDRSYHPDQLTIVDDVFGLQPGWIGTFAELAERLPRRLPFRCLMRADQIDATIARALAAGGCRMVWMGAESGSQRILDAMEKGVRVDQIKSAAKRLQAAGIEVGLFLQFGYPGEEWDDVAATLQLVRDVAPEDIGVSVSYPLPGTKFHDRVRVELGQKQNWFDSNDLAMMYRAAYPAAFYRVLHDVVHHGFRADRLGQRMRALARSPSSVRPEDLRRLAAWVYNRAALALREPTLQRLARESGHRPAPVRLIPVLTRVAASVPSRQDDSMGRDGGRDVGAGAAVGLTARAASRPAESS